MRDHRRLLLFIGVVFALGYLLIAVIGGRPSAPLAVGLYLATAVLLTGGGAEPSPTHDWPTSFEPNRGGRRGADHATERLAARLAGVTRVDPGARAHLAGEIHRTLSAAIISRAASGAAVPVDLQALTALFCDAASAEQVELTAQLTEPASLALLLSRIEAL